MPYLALTFWLLVIVFTAWGVQRLWAGMIQEKLLNTMLLPGTLVAQIGHVLGLLVTGATISNTTIINDDETGAPATTTNPEPKIPIVGPIVIGLLPILACAAAIFFVAAFFGQPILKSLTPSAVGPTLPTNLAGFWQMLRDQITLVESIVAATIAADYGIWQTWVFFYLVICLAIRIAPFPGTLRGSLGAIVLMGIGLAVIASLFDVQDPRVLNAWAVLNLTLAILLLLLFASLIARGGIGLYKLIAEESQ